MLRATLGAGQPPTQVEVGLGMAGGELDDPGYARFWVRRGEWAINGEVAECEARFGPFRSAHRFNTVMLWVGGQMVQSRRIPLGMVDVGQEYVHELKVSIVDG